MSHPKQYMAGSVPRFLRQTKLGYLPMNSLVGSRSIKGDGGVNLVLDIIMLPVPEFQRMKTNVGLQHVLAPGLKADASFNPTYIIADAKHVTVPPDEPAPENFARHYFMIEFGLLTPEKPEADVPKVETPKTGGIPFAGVVREKRLTLIRSTRNYTILKE